MAHFSNKAGLSRRIHLTILDLCADMESGTDGMRALMLLSGMLVETAFLFDNHEEAIDVSFTKLEELLDCQPMSGNVARQAMPPAPLLDFDTEQGRALAREVLEEGMDCPYEFHAMLMDLIQQHILFWEEHGQNRTESLRLMMETTMCAMAFELAAQELCDALIEQKIGKESWSLADAIAALAGTAGYRLALAHGGMDQCCWFRGNDLPDLLDQTAYVMTQEAVRLGLKCHADWRFGLPANDTPANPPTELVRDSSLLCEEFFTLVGMEDMEDQAVACAKAAGRMLAVAAGGDKPEIEPPIAKPLAMSALTESYKGVCVEYAVAGGRP